MGDPVLVAPDVSRAKLGRQVESFRASEEAYRQRGYWIEDVDDLQVLLTFTIRSVGAALLPPLGFCIRLDFTNFDLWAPSLTFVDCRTRHPVPGTPQGMQPPGIPVRAIGENRMDSLINQHPMTGLPFLCQPGVRDYHSHLQHSGDLWLLRRTTVSLTSLADLVWTLMVSNVTCRTEVVATLVGAGVNVVISQDPAGC